MRTIDTTSSRDKYSSMCGNSKEMLEAIIMRSLEQLALTPHLTSKDINDLEKLGSLLLKKKSSDLAEFESIMRHRTVNHTPEISNEQLKGLLERLTGETDDK